MRTALHQSRTVPSWWSLHLRMATQAARLARATGSMDALVKQSIDLEVLGIQLFDRFMFLWALSDSDDRLEVPTKLFQKFLQVVRSCR